MASIIGDCRRENGRDNLTTHHSIGFFHMKYCRISSGSTGSTKINTKHNQHSGSHPLATTSIRLDDRDELVYIPFTQKVN